MATLTGTNKHSLLFIPDISGYTKYINETEVSHSRHIISELLNVIVESNELELSVAEVEGDAIFFYKPNIPSLDSLLKQTKKMFINFHHHLRKYENQRICECGACKTATDLTLKFIIHSGDLQYIDVGKHHKPFGAPVVIAHKLLKNKIPSNEYLLITKETLSHLKIDVKNVEMEPIKEETYEDVKPIEYTWISMEQYHKLIPQVVYHEIPQLTKNPLHFAVSINCSLKYAQSRILDLDFKKKWMLGVKGIEDDGKINQINAEHVCIVPSTKLRFRATRKYEGYNSWVYGEEMLNPPLVKRISVYFILKELNPKKNMLTFELHLEPHKGLRVLFAPMIKQALGYHYRTSIRKFKSIVESEHSSPA